MFMGLCYIRNCKQNIQKTYLYLYKIKNETADYFQKRRSYFKFQTRKISKHSITAYMNLKQTKEQKQKEEAKKIKKIAENCNLIVQKQFWRQMNKVKKYMSLIEIQKEQKEDQQKRLESLVTDQLNLSSKLAKILQLAKNIPDLDTQKAIEQSKCKQSDDLRIKQEIQKQKEKEFDQQMVELENKFNENINLLKQFNTQIILRKGQQNTYFYEKTNFIKKINSPSKNYDFEIDEFEYFFFNQINKNKKQLIWQYKI
ncbi:snf2 family n-terminal domain protein [Ichthyophthirius multifiliis]|uniref:Snf2 family n-terminal domain protein n=1 Tax=Ichthyophthirius multifiliis TaxID=5932 RepID=G0QZV8_ICHMU|nr:snf2 family n-terminal domain protein [Ichthyophthirius multifiliis]EGR29253.1 snf2 family n-terminal domain protein [Ichthyophthirius multifiliis]|eukprot:XP_004030489.1 snf2 family n-terminal domain protein [Ichthyophthirius multifiliis]